MIQDNIFRRMSNKDKMKMEQTYGIIQNPISVVMIRTNRKSDGYTLSAFFVQTDEGWIRHNDYDVLFSYNYAHIDFEYGGIRLFTPKAKQYSDGSVHY